MKEIKAYIIDTNVLVRQTLVNIIRSEKGRPFFGTSTNISVFEMVNDIREKKPDVIFLGINEEESREKYLFYQLRKNFPELPVVVITPLNEIGALIAVSCLKHGAVDCISKPVNNGRLVLAREHFTKRVMPILEALPRMNMRRNTSVLAARAEKANIPSPQKLYSHYQKRQQAPIELVVTGGCTGGVLSLFEMIPALPKHLAVPVVLVQHLPKLYTRQLAQELNDISKIKVVEATDGQILRGGKVYLVPGGYHAEIKDERLYKTISLHRGPREHDCRPSIDVLLRSAAKIYRNQLLTVLLSGGGTDGLQGTRLAASKGSLLLVESKESALLWDLALGLKSYHASLESGTAAYLGRIIPQKVMQSRCVVPVATLPGSAKKLRVNETTAFK